MDHINAATWAMLVKNVGPMATEQINADLDKQEAEMKAVRQDEIDR